MTTILIWNHIELICEIYRLVWTQFIGACPVLQNGSAARRILGVSFDSIIHPVNSMNGSYNVKAIAMTFGRNETEEYVSLDASTSKSSREASPSCQVDDPCLQQPHPLSSQCDIPDIFSSD